MELLPKQVHLQKDVGSVLNISLSCNAEGRATERTGRERGGKQRQKSEEQE
jgi:hypothetical protein